MKVGMKGRLVVDDKSWVESENSRTLINVERLASFSRAWHRLRSDVSIQWSLARREIVSNMILRLMAIVSGQTKQTVQRSRRYAFFSSAETTVSRGLNLEPYGDNSRNYEGFDFEREVGLSLFWL